MDDILKIAELVFNIIQFIYSLKESNSATTNIMNDNRTVVLGDQINIHINNTTAHEQKKIKFICFIYIYLMDNIYYIKHLLLQFIFSNNLLFINYIYYF